MKLRRILVFWVENLNTFEYISAPIYSLTSNRCDSHHLCKLWSNLGFCIICPTFTLTCTLNLTFTFIVASYPVSHSHLLFTFTCCISPLSILCFQVGSASPDGRRTLSNANQSTDGLLADWRASTWSAWSFLSQKKLRKEIKDLFWKISAPTI